MKETLSQRWIHRRSHAAVQIKVRATCGPGWDNREGIVAMTVTLNLPPDVEAGLLACAQAEGLEVADYVRNLVQRQVIGATHSNHTEELAPEEWMRRFDEWAHSHDGDSLPLLSNYAVSRESMYD